MFFCDHGKTARRLRDIEKLLMEALGPDGHIIKELKKMSQELIDLQGQVAAAQAVEASAVTLITGLAAQILANKDDPAALETLAQNLTASNAALAAAVTANTPAAPPSDPGTGGGDDTNAGGGDTSTGGGDDTNAGGGDTGGDAV